MNDIYQKKNFKFDELNIYQENIAIIGEHYSGKTEFAKQKIVKMLLKNPNVKLWVWDHQGRFKDLFPQNQLCYYLDELSEGTQCYLPESKSEEHFSKFCKLATDQYNLHVVLDELHKFMSAQRMGEELSRLVRETAANSGVSYTAIWQRASEGHKAVHSNARHKFLFDFDIGDQDRYLHIFGQNADLFMDIDQRRYFTQCQECDEPFRKHVKNKTQHVFQTKYPMLDRYSFIYKDDKERSSVVYNGGF